MERGKCFSKVHDMISYNDLKNEIFFFPYKAMIKFHEIYEHIWIFLFDFCWKMWSKYFANIIFKKKTQQLLFQFISEIQTKQ